MGLPSENVVREINRDVRASPVPARRDASRKHKKLRIQLKSTLPHHQYSYSTDKTFYIVAAHKSDREEGGKGKEKREDIKEEIAGGQRDGERELGSFRLTSARSEVEPPVSLLNCTINLCGRKGRLYLIKNLKNLPF